MSEKVYVVDDIVGTALEDLIGAARTVEKAKRLAQVYSDENRGESLLVWTRTQADDQAAVVFTSQSGIRITELELQ